MVRTVLLVTAGVTAGLAGCSYRPGSFAYPSTTFPGTRTTVGCMDLAVQRRDDYDGSAVLNYTFGNRCEKKVEIDLAYAKVVGRFADGTEVALKPFDPGLQIQPMPLDAGMAGHEALAYSAEHELVQVCVDAASIVHRQPENWLCFARNADPTPPPVPVDDPRTPSEQMGEEPNRTLIDDDSRSEAL